MSSYVSMLSNTVFTYTETETELDLCMYFCGVKHVIW